MIIRPSIALGIMRLAGEPWGGPTRYDESPSAVRRDGAGVVDFDDPEIRGLLLDFARLAFDLAGIVDPTPVSDAASCLLALERGEWLDAAVSGVSMIPYVGDLAKLGKLPRYAAMVERLGAAARRIPRLADALTGGMRKLDSLLRFFPAGANQAIDQVRAAVGRFLHERRVMRGARTLADISGRFTFPPRYFTTWGKKSYWVQEASGRLGIPGTVVAHRSKKAQDAVSGGSGDHAGHLIANMFGAPGDARNLTLQNHKLNVNNYLRDEQRLREKLEQGVGIELTVRDFILPGGNRPQFRVWDVTETLPDGTMRKWRKEFMNTHSADWLKADKRVDGGVKRVQGSRTAQDIKSTVPSDHPGAKVLPFRRKP